MSASPLVSVIIPTYNRASLVCHAIDNVFEQTWKNIELIVVDDGSTDDTQERLRSYGDRIRVIVQPNGGPAAARNRGLKSARGEIVAFQDSDDLWDPVKLERQVRLLETLGPTVPCCLCNVDLGMIDGKKHTSFSYADMEPEFEEGLWTNVNEVLATRFVFFNQAAAIRRSTLEKLGGFDETLDFLEDYDLPLRLAREGAWGIIREPLVRYGEEGEEKISEQALQNFRALNRSETIIFQRCLAIAAAAGNTQVAKLMAYKLRRLRWQRFAEKLRTSDSAMRRAAGSAIHQTNHLHHALFRRSMWYPKVQILPPVTPALSMQHNHGIARSA